MRSRNRFSRRLFAIALFCAAAALSVVGRMGYLKIVLGPELAGQADRITCGDSVQMAYRGPILDRNGAVLATSIGASRVAVRRNAYVYDPADAATMAPLLGAGVSELDTLLRDDPRRFIWLSKSAGLDEAGAVQRMRVPGVDVHPHQRRSYPQGPLAAHLIGFAGAEAQGLEGIELLFEESLRGVPQVKRVCKDVRGRVFYSTRELGGMNQGDAIELTVDATLQSIAETELNAQVAAYHAAGGTVVVLDPRTGAVLAMANAPSFDPNDYRGSPASHRRNRAITDIFEPGSTLKPFVIAAALDARLIEPTDVFFCENGAMRIGGRTIHDHHPHGHLTVSEILQVSSNICTAKVGQRLGAEGLHGYLRAFGFGRPTRVGLPGDSTGMLAAPSRWRLINLATISFGQGLAGSALQLASAFATLANDGMRMKPYIVGRVTRADGSVATQTEPEPDGRAVDAQVARQISSMLELVVGSGGTAQRAHIEGVRVAGKTGTAQKAENGGYSRDKWLSSFVGYLPAEDPHLVIAVVVDEPKGNHFGGVVAAPVFRAIAEASLDYLHIERIPPSDSPMLIEASVPVRARPKPVPFDGTMPDLHGLSLRSAMRAMDGCDCAVQVEGAGYVVAQEPPPGDAVMQPTEVLLRLASVSP